MTQPPYPEIDAATLDRFLRALNAAVPEFTPEETAAGYDSAGRKLAFLIQVTTPRKLSRRPSDGHR